MVSILVAVLITACGESSSSSTAVNNVPVATASNISVILPEFSTRNIDLLSNVTDIDSNTLAVSSVTMLADGALPTGYSVIGNTLTIDATSIDIAYRINQAYDLNVTVSDGTDNVSYVVNSVIQDSANDAILVASSIVADTDVILGDDLNVSLHVTDTDGIISVSYSIVFFDSFSSGGVSATTVDAGAMVNNIDNIYSTVIDSSVINTTAISAGGAVRSYRIYVEAVGVVSGEVEDSNVTVIHDFMVH